MQTRHLVEADRHRGIEMLQTGWRQVDVVAVFNVDQYVVWRLYKRYLETGHMWGRFREGGQELNFTGMTDY